MILRARCILPLSAPPIENGAVLIQDGRIEWIGRWRSLDLADAREVRDLGEVVLMPGLIDAHAHLDYTGMGGQIPPPRSFPDWIKTLLSFKAHWSFSEFAESWLKGARMLLGSGTTTVADIESVPELLPQVWESTPLRVISCLEMTGVKTRRPACELLAETIAQADALPRLPGKETALSPHALYSTQPELLRLAAQSGRFLTTHLAESEAEFQMYRDAAGPLYDWLKGQRGMEDCHGASPVRLALEYGLLSPRFLAVHVNYLAPGDAEILAHAGAHVVHCPRSHDYFGHHPFPYSELARAGVNLCLGTDSLASTRKFGDAPPELNLWHEMRRFARVHPGVAPREILAMATLNAARALQKENELGQLAAGFAADAISLPYSGPVHEARLCEELLHAGAVRESLIAGELAKPA